MRISKLVLVFTVVLGSIGICRSLPFLIDERDFSVEYSGALDGTFSGVGSLSTCAEVNGGPVHTRITLQDISDFQGRRYVTIALPLNTEPGLYENLQGDGHGIWVTIYDEKQDSHVFFRPADITSLSLRLDSIPKSGREELRGSFEVDFQSVSESLHVEGDFDFKDGNHSYDCLSEQPS